ncbi:MAG: hypothetical protein K9H15_05045 [Bacteroidales bacterium]|nr:hypothetical protein [Bacteroidales bacterium]
MKIYDDYVQTIKTAISADKKSKTGLEGLRTFDNSLRKSFSFKDFYDVMPEKELLPSLKEFSNELGLQPNFDQTLGLHPDFAHLKHTENTENHYIISEFIDIKGSTNLFAKYNPETVLIISNTIQRAAIHTCLILGGYVHRLHGDGLFVYFGGRGQAIDNSVLRALQSASIFTYFVKNDLQNLFHEQGIDKIYTRIGVDLGNDRDVIWAMAGIGEISEVTTCSLHTSLASKMQANASSNGIVVGNNIKDKTVLQLQDLLQPVSRRTGNEKDRYIFRNSEENFNYAQYDLDWLNFLKRQEFIATDLQGNINLKRKVKPERSLENLTPIASKNKPYFNEKKM